jgi:hypothetical protein
MTVGRIALTCSFVRAKAARGGRLRPDEKTGGGENDQGDEPQDNALDYLFHAVYSLRFTVF